MQKFKQKKYDVVALGNALVDVLAQVSDEHLLELGLVKSSMELCDSEQSEFIYRTLSDMRKQSGGSAANTLSGLALLGGSYAFMGKIGRDELGDEFCLGLEKLGIDFFGSYSDIGTGHCLVLITPDAERTMATHLGAAVEFGLDGLRADIIESSHYLYLEGYLFDSEDNKRAFHGAVEIAKSSDVGVVLTLSDSFCVIRHRQDFMNFISGSVDILFANEEEILSLGGGADALESLGLVQSLCDIIFMTCGVKGSVIAHNGSFLEVPAVLCDNLVDTTGAGDQFAAGVLYGMVRNAGLERSARLGAYLASRVIGVYGGRLAETGETLLPEGW